MIELTRFGRVCVGLGAVFCMTGVILGAFGAHALKELLDERSTTAVWKTAVSYQMWHGLALILVGILFQGKDRPLVLVGLGLGTSFFSGSLYWLSLGGPSWLGPVTPLGGLLMIVGWSVVCLAALRPLVRES